MTACASFPDTNTPAVTAPILYLPEEQHLTPELRALQQHCNVRIQHLPHRIHTLGELSPLRPPHLRPALSTQPYVAPAAASTRCTAGTATPSCSAS